MAGSPKKRARREAAAKAAAEGAGVPCAEPPQRGPGKPTLYTRQIAGEILDRLSGGETLTSICSAPGMPDVKTVQTWVRADRDGFKARYHEARDMSYDLLEDRCRDAAYDSSDDYIADESGVRRFNPEAVQRSKLKVDVDRWILSKRRPLTHGDRIGISGVADAPPVMVEDVSNRDLARVILGVLSSAQLKDGETIDGDVAGKIAAGIGAPRAMFGALPGIADAEIITDSPAIDQAEINLNDLASGDLCEAPGGLSIEFDRLDEATGDARWHILDRIGRRVQTVWGTAKAKALSQQLAETGKIDRSTPVDTTKPTPPLRKPFKPTGPIIDTTPINEMPFGRRPRAAGGY